MPIYRRMEANAQVLDYRCIEFAEQLQRIRTSDHHDFCQRICMHTGARAHRGPSHRRGDPLGRRIDDRAREANELNAARRTRRCDRGVDDFRGREHFRRIDGIAQMDGMPPGSERC